MQATLLGVLGLALLSTLHAQDSIPVQADFQQDKLTGRWYSIGLASNSNWFKEKRHLMKMCTTIISTTAEGNLEVTSTYPKGDQCVTRNSLYTKTEQPGRFSYTSPRWGSKHNIHVVETNYEEYALVATRIFKSTGSSTMVLLYSRTKELSPEHLEMFTQFSREQGLTDDEILILPQTGRPTSCYQSKPQQHCKLATTLSHLTTSGSPALQQSLLPGFTTYTCIPVSIKAHKKPALACWIVVRQPQTRRWGGESMTSGVGTGVSSQG
uniref:Prostaglandin-H2 D-isomerase n=1 Tax=Cyanistes caeruleus TaxID=156563 RepID=A0A8C0ZK55_CYACU